MANIGDIRIVMEKYLDVMKSRDFVFHWKSLAEKMLNGLKSGYQQKQKEPDIVEIIEKIVNNISNFEATPENFKISTKSIFIHGNRSYVKFKYYGKQTKRELGDIIFILSIKYNNKKYFEKVTINQIKKSKTASWNFSQHSPKEQLYLLSRFPEFEIFGKEYNLPNYSGCLGTHGLLYTPGDFAVVSSKFLDVILANKKSCKLEDLLMKSGVLCQNSPCIPLIPDVEFWEDYFYKTIHLLHHYPYCDFPLLSNSCFAYNVYDFCDKYLRGLIGELILIDPPQFVYKHPAYYFIQDVFNSIKTKKFIKNKEQILNFISNYQSGGNNGGSFELGNKIDEGPGGFGIIHTTIDL